MTLAWQGKRPDWRSAGPAGVAKARAPSAPEPAHTFPSGELFHGDNLEVLEGLARARPASVTLAYLDPPFFTGRVLRTAVAEFDDRWRDRAAYLEALASRIAVVRDLLAPHGSLVVHVDTKTSHYVKVLCDEIFGDDCFASEIVWRYRRWPSKTPNFQRVHDVLLRYRRDAKTPPRYNVLFEPLAASTVATWGTTKQRAVFDRDSGRRARSSSTTEPTAGVPMGDVWDIGVIAPISRERTGYPSQKPEALLSRLVHALTDPGEVVLDPYAGSGTSLAVAARLGRRFVGVDASETAVETARSRISRLRLETDGKAAYGTAAARSR